MPELPEMEHYKKVLEPRIVGKAITDCQIEREKSINSPICEFAQRVKGKTVVSIERRAKFLAFHLSTGNPLLLHLMLGGKLFYGTEEESPDHTKQITLTFGEHSLFFIGLRLGYLHLLSTKELEEEWRPLGVEPLSSSFTEATFKDLLKKKRGRLKSALVDQSFIAGIGNRYSDEICFEAALFPGRDITTLNEQERSLLYEKIQSVLKDAIQAGGYLDLPVYKGDQQTGGAEEQMKVHRRAGEPCPRCGTTIVEEKIASKKTSYCPNCQK